MLMVGNLFRSAWHYTVSIMELSYDNAKFESRIKQMKGFH
jgi:hypothetical protein